MASRVPSRVHVVAPDQEILGNGRPRTVWLVGRQNHAMLSAFTGEVYGYYNGPDWIDGSYDFDEAMNIAREYDQQWEPGVND